MSTIVAKLSKLNGLSSSGYNLENVKKWKAMKKRHKNQLH